MTDRNSKTRSTSVISPCTKASWYSVFNAPTKEVSSAGTIDPDSPIAVLWSWVIFFLTVYNAFVIPFRAAFGFVSENLGFFFFFDLLGDACFVADIALNFRKVNAIIRARFPSPIYDILWTGILPLRYA